MYTNLTVFASHKANVNFDCLRDCLSSNFCVKQYVFLHSILNCIYCTELRSIALHYIVCIVLYCFYKHYRKALCCNNVVSSLLSSPFHCTFSSLSLYFLISFSLLSPLFHFNFSSLSLYSRKSHYPAVDCLISLILTINAS